jgi:hypothetical protein
VNRIACVSLAAVGMIALAACGGSSPGSSDAQAAQSALSAAATNPAVVAAKLRAKNTVMVPCEGTLPALVTFTHCVEGKLGITGKSDAAKAKRHQLGNCLSRAALSSHLTKTGGITRFTEGAGLECVAAALPPETNSASGSPSPSGSHS